MTIEVVSISITNKIVTITALDVSEEHLRWIERSRNDGFEKEVEYSFDTKDPVQRKYLYYFLKDQKAARNSETWGEAIRSIVGTIIQSPVSKYRVWA